MIDSPPHEQIAVRPKTSVLVATIAASSALLFALRLGAPCDLMDFGQELPAAYTLDAVHNHHWLVQWDNDGGIMSKPPFHTWIASGLSLLLGRVSELTLALPSGLATLSLALLLFVSGKRVFGERAGFLSAAMFLFSAAAFKAVTLVRVDTVFAMMVSLTALLVFRAWQRGSGWTAAWGCAAFATLTKGPLGIALAFAGLLAAFWESRSRRLAPVRGSHWSGVMLFVAIAGGWFALAMRESGDELVDKLFVKELVHHAITNGDNEMPGQHFHYPAIYFLSRFAPWSLLACVGFWRAAQHPSKAPMERRFERFLFCWFFAGLFLFSFTPHQRGDLLWPIYPPAALLAGRELARILARWSWARLGFATAASGLIAFLAGGWIYYQVRPHRELMAQAQAVTAFSRQLRRTTSRLGIVPTYVRTSSLLQLRLNSDWRNVAWDAAANMVRQPTPAYLVVADAARLRQRAGDGSPLYVLLEGPQTRSSHIQLISNHPLLERPQQQAASFGPWHVMLRNVRQLEKRANTFIVHPVTGKPASAVFTNGSPKPQRISALLIGATGSATRESTLPPGATMTIRNSVPPAHATGEASPGSSPGA